MSSFDFFGICGDIDGNQLSEGEEAGDFPTPLRVNTRGNDLEDGGVVERLAPDAAAAAGSGSAEQLSLAAKSAEMAVTIGIKAVHATQAVVARPNLDLARGRALTCRGPATLCTGCGLLIEMGSTMVPCGNAMVHSGGDCLMLANEAELERTRERVAARGPVQFSLNSAKHEAQMAHRFSDERLSMVMGCLNGV